MPGALDFSWVYPDPYNGTEDYNFDLNIQSILNITVVMIEHDMSFVNKVSDRILALNYGEIIAAGLPEEIKNNDKVKVAYMGE